MTLWSAVEKKPVQVPRRNRFGNIETQRPILERVSVDARALKRRIFDKMNIRGFAHKRRNREVERLQPLHSAHRAFPYSPPHENVASTFAGRRVAAIINEARRILGKKLLAPRG